MNPENYPEADLSQQELTPAERLAQDDRAILDMAQEAGAAISPEDRALLEAWTEESKTEHMALQGSGKSAVEHTVTVEAPDSTEERVLVQVGNSIVSSEELGRANPGGQSLNEGSYTNNRR